MAPTTSPGFIVATTFPGADERWVVQAGHEVRPSVQAMGQYRQAFRGQRVRAFTEAAWDALPYGAQSADWVGSGANESPRYDGGVRP